VNSVKRYRYARFKEVYIINSTDFLNFYIYKINHFFFCILVPGIVEQIELQWINTSTVRITWVEPMKSNGVIMGYYVSYTSELHIPPTSWQQLNVSRHKNSLDVCI
jgi:hypothetical protein